MPESPLFGVPMLEGGSDYPTPDAAADAKQINDQFKYAESFWGVKPVTSGALPSSPKTQQLIVETDTTRFRYWDGAAWETIVDPRGSGTSAQRDAKYPAPATAADRVALANSTPRWLNTDTNFGFEQRYFAPTTDSGEAGYLAQNARGAGGWLVERPFERGHVYKSSTAVTVPTTQTDVPGFTLTVPCSGGLMRLTVKVQWINPVSGADRVVALKAQNDGVDIDPILTQTIIPFFPGASVAVNAFYIWEFTPTAGSHTIKCRYNAAVANSVSFAPGSLMLLEEVSL